LPEEPEGQGEQLPPQILPKSYKDFSQPLHVDCNVEYDLGNLSKISKKSKPILSKDLLLMIAPSEFHTLRRPGT
jgi:hypothetical protein